MLPYKLLKELQVRRKKEAEYNEIFDDILEDLLFLLNEEFTTLEKLEKRIKTEMAKAIFEKKLIEKAHAELRQHKKLKKSQERHEDVGATTSHRYGDPQSAAKMTERDDQRTQNAVNKAMKAPRNEEGIQAVQERENRKTSSIASTLKNQSKHEKEEGREEKERQEKLQVKLRLKQLLENKKKEIENDEMPDKKKWIFLRNWKICTTWQSGMG